MQSQGAYLILMALKNNTNIALVEIELTVSIFINFFFMLYLCTYVSVIRSLMKTKVEMFFLYI